MTLGKYKGGGAAATTKPPESEVTPYQKARLEQKKLSSVIGGGLSLAKTAKLGAASRYEGNRKRSITCKSNSNGMLGIAPPTTTLLSHDY